MAVVRPQVPLLAFDRSGVGPTIRAMTSQPIRVSATGADGITRGVLQGPAYRLTSRGVRLPTPGIEDLQSRVRAALLPIGHRAIVCRSTAALLLGLPVPRLLEEDVRVHLLLDRAVPRPRRRDVATHQGPLAKGEVVRFAGLMLTSPARTYVDLAALLGRADLAAVGDAVLRSGCSPETLLEVAERRGRYPGKALARSTVDWLNAAAESPQESRLRVVLREAGLPQPRVNAVIRDAHGHPVARGDLVFDEAMLVVEYDGADHLTPERQRRDAERRASLQALGWMVLELNRYDLVDSRRAVAKVRSALLARGVRR